MNPEGTSWQDMGSLEALPGRAAALTCRAAHGTHVSGNVWVIVVRTAPNYSVLFLVLYEDTVLSNFLDYRCFKKVKSRFLNFIRKFAEYK